MSEPSGHDCPRCSVELFIEVNEDVEGVDLLICKQCWGVGITAKSLDSVISPGSLLDETREEHMVRCYYVEVMFTRRSSKIMRIFM